MAHRALGFLVLAVVACEGKTSSEASAPQTTHTSPNVTIRPAPLAPVNPESSEHLGNAQASGQKEPSSPEPLQGPLPADNTGTRDPMGVTFDAAFRFRDVPGPPKAPEVNADGIRDAQRKAQLTMAISIADTGRMAIRFTSRGLPLPERSELRARADYFGHIILWPDLSEYRVVPTGALRTVFGERRVDTTALSPGAMHTQGEGKRLGMAVRKVDVSSALGEVRLELAKVTELNDAGQLLCRTLVEMVGADPRNAPCAKDELPLFAGYSWKTGGGSSFEAVTAPRKGEIPRDDISAPPTMPKYVASGLPESAGVFFSKDELSAFRSAPSAASIPLPDAPGEGVIFANKTDALTYFLLDGIPVAAVPPQSERYVLGPPKGQYTVQWRTFLGEAIGRGETLSVPARFTRR